MYICVECKKTSERSSLVCCGKFMSPVCEKIDCSNPATKTIYGFGYLVSVCEQHYQEASQQDKEDAVRFRYAEG